MHHFLPAEWPARNAPGHHRAKPRGRCCAAQPHQTASEGSVSPEPAGASGRLGHRGQSPNASGGDRLSGSAEGATASFPQQASFSIRAQGSDAFRWLVLALIRFYQICLSPIIPSSCRYYPSCSAYAYQAVEKWGVLQGVCMAARRLSRCGPGGGFGYDPVP